MPLTIQTPSGSRSIDAFRVKRDESPRELRGERVKGTTRTLAYGDKGKRPNPLIIEVEIQEGTLDGTAEEIAAVIADAEDATSVTTPRGTRNVNGLLWHELRHRGPAATAILAFAPLGGDYA